MLTVLLHIAVLAGCMFGIFRGWRRGLGGLIPLLLGLTFGIVLAHIGGPWSERIVAGSLFGGGEECRQSYVAGNLGRGALFAVGSLSVGWLTKVIGKLVGRLSIGLINSLAGSMVGLFYWLMWLSVMLNGLLAVWPACGLESCGDRGDGNLLAEVMLMSPALLGTEDVCELWHSCRLRDARKISQNMRSRLIPGEDEIVEVMAEGYNLCEEI